MKMLNFYLNIDCFTSRSGRIKKKMVLVMEDGKQLMIIYDIRIENVFNNTSKPKMIESSPSLRPLPRPWPCA